MIDRNNNKFTVIGTGNSGKTTASMATYASSYGLDITDSISERVFVEHAVRLEDGMLAVNTVRRPKATKKQIDKRKKRFRRR